MKLENRSKPLLPNCKEPVNRMYLRSLFTFIMSWNALALMLCLSVGMAPAVLADVNPESALPPPAELPHFSDVRLRNVTLNDNGSNLAMLFATRDNDGLRIRLQVMIEPGEAAATAAIRKEIFTPHGELPPGSHTGRKFGDETYHTFDPDGGPDRFGFTLYTRIGRAMVSADLTEKVVQESHRDEMPVVEEADMRLMEDLTIGCLQRLARMGIGTMAKATPVDGPPVGDILREAIAPIAQTPGYKAAHFANGPHGHDEIEITRKTDGLKMKVHISISPTVQEAISLAQTEASRGAMEKGSLTMCQFGHQVWHHGGNREKQNNRFVLLTRMGSAVIRIEAVGGPTAARSLNSADCQTAEEITVGCLQRLVLKGIGTKMVAWRRPPAPNPQPIPEDPDGK
jgi:hypothetical protein